jgi:hypothetical protein
LGRKVGDDTKGEENEGVKGRRGGEEPSAPGRRVGDDFRDEARDEATIASARESAVSCGLRRGASNVTIDDGRREGGVGRTDSRGGDARFRVLDCEAVLRGAGSLGLSSSSVFDRDRRSRADAYDASDDSPEEDGVDAGCAGRALDSFSFSFLGIS